MHQAGYFVASGEWCRLLAGRGFRPYQTLNLLHWVLSGGAGWPGRGSSLKANSIFRTAWAVQEARKGAKLLQN